MSMIITRPSSTSPHPLAVTAPGHIELDSALRSMDRAHEVVKAYVETQSRGQRISCMVWRKNIELTGHGKVWRDERGHRTLHKCRIPYGQWDLLDQRIEEALAYYTSKN